MLFFFTPKSDQKEIILTILITIEAGHEEQEKTPTWGNYMKIKLTSQH